MLYDPAEPRAERAARTEKKISRKTFERLKSIKETLFLKKKNP
jgi:hypothetical protein